MADKVGSLFFTLGVKTGEFQKKLNDAAASLQQFAKSAKAIGSSMSMFVTTPILAAGGAAIKFASDFEESLNKVDVAFGDASGQVRDFAKETLKTYGIAQGTALDMAALFGDMATGMGIAQNEAANLSTSMVGLAGDIASFKNMNIKEVTTALNGVFTGETESLKRLGVVMTETNLKQFALEKGITKTLEAMSQGEKVMLRYEFVMAMMANSQGDFERTGGAAANQMRVFTESLKELSVQFGQVMLPAFTSAVKAVNAWVDRLRSMDDSQRKVIISIAAVVAAAGPLLVVLGSLGAAIPAIVAGAAALGTAFSTLALGPIGVLVLVMIGLIDTVDRIVERMKEAVVENKAFSKTLDSLTKSIQAANAAQDAFNTAKQSGINLTKEQAEATIEQLKAQKAEIIANRERAEGLLAVAKARLKSMEGKQYLPHQKEYQEIQMLRKSVEEYDAAIKTALHSEVEIGSAISEALTIVTSKTNSASKAFNIAGKTVVELENRYKQLSEALASTIPGSKEYMAINKEMLAIKDKLNPKIDAENKALKEQAALQSQLQNFAGNKALLALTEDLTRTMGKAPTRFFEKLFGPADGPIKNLTTLKEKLIELYTPLGQTNALLNDLFTKYAATDFDPLKALFATLNDSPIEGFQDRIKEALQSTKGSAEEVIPVFQALGQALSVSLQGASAGWVQFAANVVSGIGVLMKAAKVAVAAYKAKAIAAAIAGGSEAGASTGPLAPFTTPAFIATLLGVVGGAIAAIPKFAKGGAVTGPTLAMVGENPASRGEAIIPFERMGSFLSQFANMGGNGMQQVMVTGQIAGDTIRLSNQKSGINNGRVRWDRGVNGRALVN
jgi:hypothetical protein